MDKRLNGIRPPKESQGTKCKGKARYTKIIEYFTEYLNTEKYNGLLTGGGNGKRYYIQTEKFNEIFYNNSFNFLDVLYLFISCASSQQVGVLNFLLSNETNYSAKKIIRINDINFDNLNKDLKKYEDIEKRRLFTLAILSLIQDYFNTYEIKKETGTIEEKIYLSNYEINLKLIFENIFNNNKDLLSIFKKIKTAITYAGTTEKRLNLYKYLENIFTKTTKINNQINGVKQQILNYFNFCYNSKEQNKNWVKDFLNTYETEIVSQQIESEQQKSNFLQQERERLEILELEKERLEKLKQQKIEQYNNFWINCEDGYCYSLNNYIKTVLNGNKEQFFYDLGITSTNCQNGIKTPFCNTNGEPLTPDYIFNELYKIEDCNTTYFNKFNEGIHEYYKQQLIELQTQYDTLIQIFNQQNPNQQVQNSNGNTQMQKQIPQYIQSEVINEAQYNITQNNQNTFTTTFQKNQQISQNLNETLGMFGNGCGQWFR